MSTTKKQPEFELLKVTVGGHKYTYKLITGQAGYRAEMSYRGQEIQSQWRSSRYTVARDIPKEMQKADQRIGELQKLEAWNAGLPIFGGGGGGERPTD